MRIQKVLLVATFAMGLFVACTPLVPPHAENVDQICDTLCHRRGECDSRWDQKACQTSCRERGSKRRPYWRADYVESALHCIQSSSCDVVSDHVAACFEKARPEPTDMARQACRAVTAKNRTCSGQPEDIDKCLDKWGYRDLSDPVLKEIVDCTEQRCARFGGCIREVLGGG